MDWASTGGRYTYEFMFDESPESATEEKELRAMEILDEEAILKIWETPGATKEDKEEHLRMLGFLLPRDIEKIAISHYWDFWLVPDPEPGDRTELVCRLPSSHSQVLSNITGRPRYWQHTSGSGVPQAEDRQIYPTHSQHSLGGMPYDQRLGLRVRLVYCCKARLLPNSRLSLHSKLKFEARA